MSTWVAFLRAINLGPTRKFARDDVVAATEDAGYDDVATYLNTGNVRVATSRRSRERIEATLERAYAERAGFAVPTIAFCADELCRVLEVADGLGHDGPHLVSLLKREPEPAAVEALLARAGPREGLHVEGRAAHLLIAGSQLDATLSNAVVEKHLGPATNRNLNVVRTLVQRWCS